MKLLIWLWRFVFSRTFFYKFNLRVFDLCLRGIGVLNYEGYKVSGEQWFLDTFLRDKDIKTIIDVGANTDPYGLEKPDVKVYALEPHPGTFKKLIENTKDYKNIFCFPLGLSDKPGKAILYDMTKEGTALATLQKDMLEKQYRQKLVKSQIVLTTLDEFARKQKINRIDLLKIDTEGNEYKVLQGAKKTLANKEVRYILFEFNEMNAYGRVFFRDFCEFLEGYSLYRLLPDGLADLGKYRPITHELFAFQNIVAIRNQ